MTRPRRLASPVLGALLLLAHAAIARADDGDEHAAHRAALAAARYERSVGRYAVPEVALRNQANEPVSLTTLLAGPGGVALDFIFTSCNTICPVMTATFSRMRTTLGTDAGDLRLVSISIDPDHDTPAVLKDFASRFGIGPEWPLLTGDAGQVVRVLKAFDAYTGSKSNHQPLVFLRAPGRGEWVRIAGFASAADLASEYRRLRAE